MNIYGDLSRFERAEAVSASVVSAMREADHKPAGIERHAQLVYAFIRAGELVQGIADAEFEQRGFDAPSALQDCGAAMLREMAATVDRSWQNGFAADVDTSKPEQHAAALGRAGWIKTRTGEGYAHYGLYPESYLEAARASGLGPKTCVIGIRSIGTGLAALVAAALQADRALSVRPVGHPFQRRIHVASDAFALKIADNTVNFAIVDEGPGLSGSSFASVARWLAGEGVDFERLHFFPSHGGGPGEHATDETRQIWRRCQCHPASSEAVLSRECGLRDWVESYLGPLRAPLEEFQATSSVPRDTRFERQKFLARNDSGAWLVKFAGIGGIGERKLRDSQAIASSGFGPATQALCYGFLVQKLVRGKPLSVSRYDRRKFLKSLGSYLAFRAQQLGPAGEGASIEELRRMAIENTSRSLGAEAGGSVEALLGNVEHLGRRIRPVRTDNRLHAWEWLANGDSFLKIDAVDHCEAHDLIGCQDIAWDVAGAIAEHELTPKETAALVRQMRLAGASVDAELTAAMMPCYLAFQLGMWSTASGFDADIVACRYARRLSHLLKSVRSSTGPHHNVPGNAMVLE